MPLRAILCLTLILSAQAARAEGGFFDSLFGSSKNAPPNPFASNYASAPPTREEVRRVRERRADPAMRGRVDDPVPPGRLPE